MTITLTPDQTAMLGEFLDLAHNDLDNYINVGNPSTDYRDEWPEVAKNRAKIFRFIGELTAAAGMNGEPERWEALADEYEPVCAICGKPFTADQLTDADDDGDTVHRECLPCCSDCSDENPEYTATPCGTRCAACMRGLVKDCEVCAGEFPELEEAGD
jgi:hypothetical protein